MKGLFIAPYIELATIAEDAIRHYAFPFKVIIGDLQKGLQMANEAISQENVDIIISRGGTASLLRRSLSIPVFEINITSYDLLRAIFPFSSRKEKIAVIGYENIIRGARSISEILHIDLGYFQITQQEQIRNLVIEAQNWGAEVVIGDTISVNTARDLGIYSELVRSGPEAVVSTVETAINFFEHMEEEMLKVKRLNLIMEHADNGIIYLASDSKIELMNTKVENILQKSKRQLLNQPLSSEILPPELVYAVKNQANNQLVHFNGNDFLVDVINIDSKDSHAATLVFIQSTGRIKDLEGLLRRQVISQGFLATYTFETLVTKSAAFKKTIEIARKYSQTNSTILLSGETGSGKEVFAQAIHNASYRKSGPFVAVNCAALPDSLLESELFGYAEGSFTGARRGGKPGLFETAHKGTIFLDEVNEMSNNVQTRFLRVLQEKKIMRLGDNRLYDVDVRVIAACNKNLFDETEAGNFRKDLYYRLKILDIDLLPLRHRKEDILHLFKSFIHTTSSEKDVNHLKEIPDNLLQALVGYSWPGNVRELKNFAEKASILFTLDQSNAEIVDMLIKDINLRSKPTGEQNQSQLFPIEENTLREIDSSIIKKSWESNNGNISKTARQLGIDRATVRKYLFQGKDSVK